MFTENQPLFNKLADICGNRYLAVRYLASKSRKLGDKYSEAVMESKLLTWALTGVPPYSEDELDRRVKLDSDVAELEDYLCYVDDDEVAEQVRLYYIKSLRNRGVVLDSSNTLDTYRQMRVNVILRMIWYSNIENIGGQMAKINLSELKYDKGNTQTVDIEQSAVPEKIVTAKEPEIQTEDQTEEEFNITAPITEEVEKKILKVRNMRIYPKPSTNVPARVFTGNIEIIGKVDRFTIVKYVRASFGAVTGYILDENLVNV